jgi:DNA-binding transcriptional LysR family regulator
MVGQRDVLGRAGQLHHLGARQALQRAMADQRRLQHAVAGVHLEGLALPFVDHAHPALAAEDDLKAHHADVRGDEGAAVPRGQQVAVAQAGPSHAPAFVAALIHAAHAELLARRRLAQRRIGMHEAHAQAVGRPPLARGMVLSPAGERLAVHVRSAALEGERVLEGLRTPAPATARPLRVACTDGFACGFMAGVMSDFRQQHGPCAIHLFSTSPEGVSGMVARGEVDVGLKFSVSPERALHIEHQQPAPVLLVTSPGHPSARKRRVTPADTTRFALALPNPGTTLRQTLDLAFQLEGLQPEVAYCGNLATLLTLVLASEVATFASRLSVSHLLASRAMVARPLPELQGRQRKRQVLTHRKARPAGLQRAFVDGLTAAVIRQA